MNSRYLNRSTVKYIVKLLHKILSLYNSIYWYRGTFNLMSLEDISENIGESHHCKNLKFETFAEAQLKMASAGLVQVSCQHLYR